MQASKCGSLTVRLGKAKWYPGPRPYITSQAFAHFQSVAIPRAVRLNDAHCRNKRIFMDEITRKACESEQPAML